MSIITFWNDDREQSGKTLTAVAVAINMAMERNSKILLISTSVADSTIKKCFWDDEKTKTKYGLAILLASSLFNLPIPCFFP